MFCCHRQVARFHRSQKWSSPQAGAHLNWHGLQSWMSVTIKTKQKNSAGFEPVSYPHHVAPPALYSSKTFDKESLSAKTVLVIKTSTGRHCTANWCISVNKNEYCTHVFWSIYIYIFSAPTCNAYLFPPYVSTLGPPGTPIILQRKKM